MTTSATDDAYDPQADFEASIAECYRAVRARVAAGGPGWVPQAPGTRRHDRKNLKQGDRTSVAGGGDQDVVADCVAGAVGAFAGQADHGRGLKGLIGS